MRAVLTILAKYLTPGRRAAAAELGDLDGDEQAQNLYHQMADALQKY